MFTAILQFIVNIMIRNQCDRDLMANQDNFNRRYSEVE
jgi:hypothetical protein